MSNPIIAPVGAIFVHEGVDHPDSFLKPTSPPVDVVVLGKLVGVAKFGICRRSLAAASRSAASSMS